MEIFARNVNDALKQGVELFRRPNCDVGSVAPRGKPTLEIKETVMTVYEKPQERVLFLPERDANPFLHLFESLWLLAGRRDLKFMEFLQPRFKDYSKEGVLEGSYGWRWRRAWKFDQLQEIINLLQSDPHTRRAVLTMWHPEDLLDRKSPDVPCNTSAYFKIRDGRLRLTVLCRSNDMIWGAYGANAVQFSVLQEYVADKLLIKPGTLTQVSDSLHVYQEGPEGAVWDRVRAASWAPCPYPPGLVKPWPLEAFQLEWDRDLKKFFEIFDRDGPTLISFNQFKTYWWQNIARLMWNCYISHKNKSPLAKEYAEDISATDWKLAVTEWLDRRIK